MSAIALSLDPSLMIGSRRGLSWQDPPTDHHHNYHHQHFDEPVFGNNFSIIGQTGDSETMSPISATSSASSPAHSLTPDQQELKRQQDRVRRDSRLSSRMRRYSSAPFADSTILSPADTIGDLGLAVYNPTASTTAPMMAESPQLLPTSSYMHSYSPTPSEHSHGYSLSYQQPLPQSYNATLDYASGYMGSSEFGLANSASPLVASELLTFHSSVRQSQTPSSVSHGQENSLLYKVPKSPKTPSEDPASQGTPSSRPKPRCWEHGCNGRQFSTFSNLLRHQREKSGQAAKASCPNCGAEFTRTTARNGHMLHDKCKRRTTDATAATLQSPL